ncbi:MAG: hypothetical protein Q9162_003068 [Coniocarpon cinnabarinum]
MACVCNPIFINTFVVFVRLYWFEKRFQSIVREAAKIRRTRERSRSKSGVPDEERNVGIAQRHGVGNRKITVMRPDQRDVDAAAGIYDKAGDSSSDTVSSDKKEEEENNDVESEKQRDDSSPTVNEKMKRESQREELSPTTNLPRTITFADQVHSPSSPPKNKDEDRYPRPKSHEDSIAFVQKQNNPHEDDTLYIPSPRDFDRGAVPKHVKIAEGEDLQREKTVEDFPRLQGPPQSAVDAKFEMNEDDHPARSPPERTKTSTSDSAVVLHTASSRMLHSVKSHLPFQSPRSTAPSNTNSEHTKQKSSRPRRDSVSSSEGLRHRGRTHTFASFLSSSRTEPRDPMPYLSYQATIGRNSAFFNLSEEQRDELGGIEYRALKLLAMVLCLYFVGFHLLGLLSYLPWIENSSAAYKSTLAEDGVAVGWWGVFTPASMFNDLGFTLTPDSMNSFNKAIWILILGSFLIIIGNTGFPCMLRLVIWAASKCVSSSSALWEELQFLLDHPRRCFTLLFPSKATWWLFWVLVLLNGIDLIFFVVLDLHDTPVEQLSGGIRFLDGLFQAASTRTAGFSVVNLAYLHPAIQVSYLIMMYISVFPIAISVRRTNVYEEKSLGVYGSNDIPDDEEHSYVGAHLRRQLSFDLWYVFLGLFIISIVEGDRIQNTNDSAFSIFSVLFEIVSAYGTVGLSMGYPNLDTSFSSQFRVLSKLVIIAMQLRGRHRGLPYALDKAVLLPSEALAAKEHEEATKRELARKRGTFNEADEDEKSPTNLEGLNGVDAARGGIVPQRTNTGGQSLGQASGRSRGYSLGRLITNAMGAGPTVSRKLQ